MRTTVTAVIVAHSGDWLDATLEALAAQTVQADRIIGVVNGKNEEVAAKFQAFGATQVIATGTKVSFGGAVSFAEKLVPLAQELPEFTADPEFLALHGTVAAAAAPTVAVDEWLWLLTEDSAPEPKALRALLSSVLRAPSVVIAGPKLIDWDQPERIVELGQGLTVSGDRWLLRRQELDQQQYDHLQDALGVGPTGMLVRRTTWRELEGFDPALPVYDDALDLCVRARLSGHRVVVAPRARVRVAMTGIAGPALTRKHGVMRKNHTQARISHLHRRISYAPPIATFFMWLLLPLLGLFRMGWALLREQPGNMLGELWAALVVFCRPGALLRSRRRVKRSNLTGWGAIRPLRTEAKAVRTAKLIDKEAILAAQGRARKELHFITTGGLTTLLISVLASVALTWWLYGQEALTGGSSARLSSFQQLWANTRIAEGVPADPFTWVLAVLGSATFFDPSLALVIFLALAIPLATLGGWMWGAQFTVSPIARAFTAFAWSLSPVLLGSIDHARIQTVVLTVVLPWLLLAATRAHESWAWAGTCSLLAATALAAAPVLIPFGVLLLVVGCATHPRQLTRILSTAIAPAALFFPVAAHAFVHRDFWALLRDPGITSAYQPANLRQLLLGFPSFDLDGWGSWFNTLGLTVSPTLLIGLFFLPLALLALLGAFTARPQLVIHAALLGGGGMVTAFFSSHTALTVAGNESVNLWAGSGLALYWIALITLAACGTSKLHRLNTTAVVATLLSCALAVSPLLLNLATGRSEARHHSVQVPSLIAAAGNENQNLQTLKITALAPDAIRTQIITGSGTTLDELRTASFTVDRTPRDIQTAAVVQALFSPGSTTVSETLAQVGISYVLLDSAGDDVTRAELQRLLEEQGALETAGVTAAGHVWRASAVDQEAIQAAQEALSQEREAAESRDPFVHLAELPLTASMVWLVQVIVLGGVILLALPTGAVAEQPPRRKRLRRDAAQMHVIDTTAADILHKRTEKKQRAARRRRLQKRTAKLLQKQQEHQQHSEAVTAQEPQLESPAQESKHGEYHEQQQETRNDQ